MQENFKFGAGDLFESKIQAEVPKGDVTKIKMKMCLVQHEIPFLCGRDNIENLGVAIDFRKKTATFGESHREEYLLRNSRKGHYVIDFEKREMKSPRNHKKRFDNIINVIKNIKKKDMEVFKKVRAAHRQWNHKSEENMLHVYKKRQD